MNIPRFITLLIIFYVLAMAQVQAGAWVRAKGEMYSKAALSHFRSDENFAAKGNKKIPGPTYEENMLSLYAEYGISKKWTGVFSLDAKDSTTNVNGRDESTSGLADGWFFLKRELINKDFVFSFQGGVKIPMGYDRLATPPLGQGQVDYEGRFLLGKSFYPFPGYGNLEAGYRKRNGDFSNEFVYVAETGAYVTKSLMVKLLFEMVGSESDDVASTTPNRHPNVFDEEYTKLSPAVLFFFRNGFGVQLEVNSVIAGGNTASGETYSFGLFYLGSKP